MTASHAPDPALDCFAITAPGLERLAASELAALSRLSGLGLRPGPAEPGGVPFRAGREGIYAANLRLRTASRIVVRVGEFEARAFHELERHSRRLPWERWAAAGVPARFRVTCRKSRLYHSDAVAERLADALVRRVGGAVAGAAVAEREEEDGDGEEPAEGAAGQLFVVRVSRDVVTISADSSGALLHRRGYRQAVARAPLRETLAAGLLLAAGYDGAAPLLDPLCGSGTIPIEGALIARRIAPGLATPDRAPRDFAFRRWPDFDGALWTRAVERAMAEALPAAPAPILGSDRDEGAVEAARANAARAGVGDDIRFERRSLSAVAPPAGSAAGLIAANPPYGVRVGEKEPLRDLFARFGQLLRERFGGWSVALLTADRRLESQLRLPLDEALRTSNGGIPVRVVKSRLPADAA